MEICPTKSDARAAVARLKADGSTLGLVPTMGYLHEGHLTLVRAAKASCDKVAATIFVNPTQFDEASDLAAYPQDLERDKALLEAEGVDMVFIPGAGEMYHPEAQTIVEPTDLANILIGALRPGHFRGVATVVTKLFNIQSIAHLIIYFCAMIAVHTSIKQTVDLLDTPFMSALLFHYLVQ